MGSEVEEENNKTNDQPSPAQTPTKTEHVVNSINTFNIGLNEINKGLENIRGSIAKYNLAQDATRDYHINIMIEQKQVEHLISHIQMKLKYEQLDLNFQEFEDEVDNLLKTQKSYSNLHKKSLVKFTEPTFNSQILKKYDANMQKYILEHVDELRADRLSSLKLIKLQLEQHFNQELQKQFIQALQNKGADYLIKDMFPEKFF